MKELIPVYLFGAIGNGRTNELALQAIKVGIEVNGGEVLTPHVASFQLAMAKREELGWKGLFTYDVERLARAKLAIGEISDPSTGFGFELASLLLVHKVPVLGLRNVDATYKSAMLDGNTSSLFNLRVYSNLDDIAREVYTFMRQLKRNA